MSYTYLNSRIWFGPKTLVFDQEKFNAFWNTNADTIKKDYQNSKEEFEVKIKAFISLWNRTTSDDPCNESSPQFTNWRYLRDDNLDSIAFVIGETQHSVSSEVEEELSDAYDMWNFDFLDMLGVW